INVNPYKYFFQRLKKFTLKIINPFIQLPLPVFFFYFSLFPLFSLFPNSLDSNCPKYFFPIFAHHLGQCCRNGGQSGLRRFGFGFVGGTLGIGRGRRGSVGRSRAIEGLPISSVSDKIRG
ncbi:MAG: hypothetical protein ACK56I_03530, partial [bacterium]